MSDIYDLSKEEAGLMRLKQELVERRKKTPPQAGPPPNLPRWNLTPESISENDRLERQLEETESKLREIRQKLSKKRT